MEKNIKIIYLENTNWDESNKIQHDHVFSYVYQLKDRQSYQVNSVNGQNAATFSGRREYELAYGKQHACKFINLKYSFYTNQNVMISQSKSL